MITAIWCPVCQREYTTFSEQLNLHRLICCYCSYADCIPSTVFDPGPPTGTPIFSPLQSYPSTNTVSFTLTATFPSGKILPDHLL